MMRILTALLLCVSLSRPAAAFQANDDLQAAVEVGNLDRVRALIDKGADVNARSTSGRTALMYAATRGSVAVLEVLIQKGADVNAQAIPTGLTPSWEKGWTALMYAANHGNCSAVRILLDKGANAKATADDGATVLMQSTGCRDDILAALQRTDAKFAKGNIGNMGLVNSALGGDVRALRSLLDKGADVNAKSKDGGTALMVAAVMGHADVMRVLIERGADVNARSNTGDTALLLVIENTSNANAIRGLVALNPRANQNALGDAPQPPATIVRVLLDGGADVNATNNEGGTALMYAVSMGDPEIVRALVKKSARVNARNNKGHSALMVAIETALITMDSDPAVLRRTANVVRLLLDNGADVNVAGNEGETALMYAAKECDEATVQMLLDKGAKANAISNDGISAMVIARAAGCKKAVRQLRNTGAK